jgi:hypothetical protein
LAGKGGSISTVHIDWPVAELSAKSFDPELKYITPSIASGVPRPMLSAPSAS